MSLTPIVITATFENPDGTPASGRVVARLSEPISNGSLSIDPRPIVGQLTAGGVLLTPALGPFTLFANDDTGTLPQGSTYSFLVDLDDTPVRTFSAVVPAAAPAGTITLHALEG